MNTIVAGASNKVHPLKPRYNIPQYDVFPCYNVDIFWLFSKYSHVKFPQYLEVTLQNCRPQRNLRRRFHCTLNFKRHKKKPPALTCCPVVGTEGFLVTKRNATQATMMIQVVKIMNCLNSKQVGALRTRTFSVSVSSTQHFNKKRTSA